MDQAPGPLKATYMDCTDVRVLTCSVQENLVTLPLANLTVLTLEAKKPPPCKEIERLPGKQPSCSLSTADHRLKMRDLA